MIAFLVVELVSLCVQLESAANKIALLSCPGSNRVNSNLNSRQNAAKRLLESTGPMSKFELQRLASERSGVTYEESLVATEQLSPTIYERLGEKGIRRLSESFYDRVFADKETAWFLNIFSSSTRAEAVENQYLFFVQTFGGPDLYRQKKGKYTRLVGRHANYNIGPSAADRWVEHMMGAVREDDTLAQDALVVEALDKYFRYTAHYIVVASEYMRPDQVRARTRRSMIVDKRRFLRKIHLIHFLCQLSGGTQIDPGRIW
jgi:hemoglobin